MAHGWELGDATRRTSSATDMLRGIPSCIVHERPLQGGISPSSEKLHCDLHLRAGIVHRRISRSITQLGLSIAFHPISPSRRKSAGTSTGIGPDGSVVAETGWGTHVDQVVAKGDTVTYAEPLPGEFDGGGRSTILAEPDYQRGVVPNGLARGNRVSADVAADADPYTGYLIGIRPIIDDTTLETGPYEEETYGGTSLSAPLVAAQMARCSSSSASPLASPTR